ncbi:MAG TPA: DUF2007 domain-containing protein [Pirellulales bacterium]|jgi:hypothetical protein|nr:DUF2007 domain-containing protein [Pirellulales bacterium]
MNDQLVTIARFSDQIQAALARNDLQAAGIKSFLPGESISAMAWHLTNAFGGIRLQVAAEDAPRAIAILSETASQFVENAEAGKASETPADDADLLASSRADSGLDGADPIADEFDDDGVGDEDSDAELDPWNRRERSADRAFRGAVFGLLFLPLQIYVFWLLLKVFVLDDSLAPRLRRQAILAAAINLPIIFLFLVWLSYMFSPGSFLWPRHGINGHR